MAPTIKKIRTKNGDTTKKIKTKNGDTLNVTLKLVNKSANKSTANAKVNKNMIGVQSRKRTLDGSAKPPLLHPSGATEHGARGKPACASRKI